MKQNIKTYEDAKEYLGISDKSLVSIIGVSPKNERILRILAQLLTIADAWNEQDGFVADFRNPPKVGYTPMFGYNPVSKSYLCTCAVRGSDFLPAIGSHLNFATEARASEFGKIMELLYYPSLCDQ